MSSGHPSASSGRKRKSSPPTALAPCLSVLTSSEGRMVEKIEGPTSERQVVRRWTRDHSVHGEAVPLDLVA
jgi:hypothetical protein